MNYDDTSFGLAVAEGETYRREGSGESKLALADKPAGWHCRNERLGC